MKKTPLVIGMSILVLIIVLGGIFYFLNQKEKERQQSLSEMQQVNSTIKETPHALSLEKQKQVEKISELYTLEENKFESTIIETLSQYKADISKEDIVRVEEIIGQSESPETLHAQIQNTLGIPLLKRDIDVLFEAQQNIVDEKELKQDRLSVLYEKNEKEIQENSQRLFTLSLKESLKNYAPNIEPEKTEKIIAEIQEKCFVTYNILDEKVFNSFEKQKNQIESVIISTLGKYTALSSSEKNTLNSKILEELEKLEILQKKSNATSFFEIPSIDFEKILGFFGSKVHAQEVTLSVEERNILILKTQILIDKLIQKGIDIEIDYTDKKLTLEEYNTAVNQNLVEIEELIIFKESLENDASVISLDDIQRFNLGSYVDDSKEIQNLPTIAYVQSKSGHIMVYNIHGSTRLGEENDALYSGYGIETLGDSEATIVFSDESILRLEEYSKVIITAPTENNIELTLERGNIWTRVLKPLFSGDVFAIDTGEVSLGVRGTSVYISKSDTTNIQIVDSYDPSGSGSVTLTKKDTGAQTLYTNGKEILVSSGGTISSTSRDRKAILQANSSTIGKYLREDLEYMSLLLDDRKRGFYNTPLEKKNNGENFLAKIEGELNSSLPTNTDKSFILENSELLGETINTGSIYGVLKKDEIISQIKKSPFGDVPGKINAIKNTNFQNIEKNLTNKREIENRIDYKIAKKLAKESFLSPTRIEGNFGSFDINTPKNTLDTLQEEKRKLKINSGSNILSTDFYLPGDFSGGKGIITWESSDESVLKIEPDGTRASYIGKVFPEQQRKNVFLTATLSLGDFTKKKDFGLVVVPQILSPENELEAAAKILDDFINNIAQKKFNNFILSKSGGMILTESGGIDFSQSGGIIPIITWTGSSYIGGNGNTHKPDFSKISDVNDIGGYASGRIIAILQHPKNPLIADITREYDVGIKIKKEKADEKLTRLKGNFWTYFENSLTVNNFLNRTTLSGTSISLPGDYDIASTRVGKYITGATLKYTVSGSGSLSGKILNLTQGTNTGSVTIKPKLYIAGFSGFLSPDKKTYSIPPLAAGCVAPNIEIGGDCYELVASAEYDTKGKYELIKTGYFGSGSISATVGSGVSDNTLELGDSSRGITQLDKRKSLVKVGAETGIYLDKTGTNDYLSYDLSSVLSGSTDWAIEMSVRGEDLKRSGQQYLFSTTTGGNFGIYTWKDIPNNKNKLIYSIAGTPNEIVTKYGTSEIPNGYQRIFFTPTKHYIEGFGTVQNNNTGAILSNIIKIGSNNVNGLQWNGIINYLRIYKRAE